MILTLKRAVVGCGMVALMAACSSGSAEKTGQAGQRINTAGGQCIDTFHWSPGVTWHAQDDGTCTAADDGTCAFESQVKSLIRSYGGDPNGINVLMYSQGSDGYVYYVLWLEGAGGDTAAINAQLPDIVSQYPDPPVSAQIAFPCTNLQGATNESLAAAGIPSYLTWDPECPNCFRRLTL
jgi:hypothetical protein